MACCCNGGKSKKSNASCLGRCDLPKHKCLRKREYKPGPVPKNMGWLYTAEDAPPHQLRCGWRPGHVFCPVLKKIEQHNGMKAEGCSPCSCCCKNCAPAPCCNPD